MRPTTLEEAAQAVRESPRVVIGKRPGEPNDLRLDLTGLAGPLEITPENLSATFLAGSTVQSVQEALAPYGLWWPVDARGDRTLGAVLATAGPYPGRTGYGPVRDWVLGLEVILAGGQRMDLGRPTMKNVAGYDLTRLMIGSGGSLGVIAAATVRLLPRPERQVTLQLPRERYPAALDLAAACEWDGCRLLVRLDGRAPQVQRRLALLLGEPGPADAWADRARPTDAPAPADVRADRAGRPTPADPWAEWHRRAGGRYVRREAPDWSTVGAPLLGLWRTDEPFRLSPLALRVREAVAPGNCFNPTPGEVEQHG